MFSICSLRPKLVGMCPRTDERCVVAYVTMLSASIMACMQEQHTFPGPALPYKVSAATDSTCRQLIAPLQIYSGLLSLSSVSSTNQNESGSMCLMHLGRKGCNTGLRLSDDFGLLILAFCLGHLGAVPLRVEAPAVIGTLERFV